MGNTKLPFDERGAFVDPSEQYITEVERPNAVVDLLETDAVGA